MSPLDSRSRRFFAVMDRWKATVVASHPGVSQDYAATLCDEVVKRAQLLSESSYLRTWDVAEFLLDRTRFWILDGLPLDKIGPRLPKTLADLGALKIAEGGRDGGPLSVNELKQVKRIIQ